MPLEIIGAGFGRTGTRSLKEALEILGRGPCYHMVEVKHNDGHIVRWNRIARGGRPDWDTLFEEYRAAVDWPATHYWRELAAHYPQARVILTVREPDDWFTSFKNTIAWALGRPLPPDAPEDAHLHRATLHKLITSETFHGSPADRATAVEAYLNRIETVARQIDPERLLIYNVADGWEPLCRFLRTSIPAAPFPRLNTTDDFRSQDPRRANRSAGNPVTEKTSGLRP